MMTRLKKYCTFVTVRKNTQEAIHRRIRKIGVKWESIFSSIITKLERYLLLWAHPRPRLCRIKSVSWTHLAPSLVKIQRASSNSLKPKAKNRYLEIRRNRLQNYQARCWSYKRRKSQWIKGPKQKREWSRSQNMSTHMEKRRRIFHLIRFTRPLSK